jgi:hypothetical protein
MATKAAEPVQVRFRISRPGLTYGLQGIERGQVVEVPTTAEAARLYAAGYAQPPHLKELGAPYVPYTSASRLRDTLSPGSWTYNDKGRVHGRSSAGCHMLATLRTT